MKQNILFAGLNVDASHYYRNDVDAALFILNKQPVGVPAETHKL